MRATMFLAVLLMSAAAWSTAQAQACGGCDSQCTWVPGVGWTCDHGTSGCCCTDYGAGNCGYVNCGSYCKTGEEQDEEEGLAGATAQIQALVVGGEFLVGVDACRAKGPLILSVARRNVNIVVHARRAELE